MTGAGAASRSSRVIAATLEHAIASHRYGEHVLIEKSGATSLVPKADCGGGEREARADASRRVHPARRPCGSLGTKQAPPRASSVSHSPHTSR